MQKALHPRDKVDKLYIYREKRVEEDMLGLKTVLTY